MGKGRYILERLAEEADLREEPMPGLPLIELAGDRRVLLENHLGVKAYGRDRIVVKVKFGTVCVCGEDLEMARMSRDQLVICGRIGGVSLHRRK